MKIEIDGEEIDVQFARGFLAAIACSFRFWLTHHAAIRAATPLREVTLTTRPEVEYRYVGKPPVESQARIASLPAATELQRRFEWRDIPRQIESVDKVLLDLLAAEFKDITFRL